MTQGQPPAVLDLRAPLIGRDADLRRLDAIVRRALSDGEARAVTIVGPAGMGKTRLVSEYLRTRAPSEPPLRAFWGVPRSERLAYGLFERLLSARFGVADGADRGTASAQIRDELALVLEDRRVGDVSYFLGELMGLPFAESPLTRAVADDPSQARLMRRAILRSFVESDAERGPLCLVCEDVHIADEDSIELLRYLIENLKGPIVIACLARPEFLARHEGWRDIGGARHELFELSAVSAHESVEIMGALLSKCPDGVAPPRLIDAGVGMAGGTPGLLEHMVRIFFDSGVLHDNGGVWEVDLDRLASAKLPLTVADAVAARIAALSAQDRRLLEHAAAMGSVFWLGGLVALGRLDQKAPDYWEAAQIDDVLDVEKKLADLVQRDYVLNLPDSAFSGEQEYIFKHNLERERIAQLSAPAASRRYHRSIADWLAQKETLRSQEEYVAMLARHLEHGGSLTRAAFTYLDAGNIARQQYAAKKAHDYYQKGLGLLGDDDARRRIDALHNYGDVLLLLGKTDEALAAFREMHAIAFRLGLKAKGGAAHNRIGRVYRDTGSLDLARDHLETALALFESVGDSRGVAASHDDIGKLLWMRGEYEQALEELKKALDMRKEHGDGRSIALSLNNIGLVWRDHGQQAQAREALEAALKIRRELDDPLGIVESLNDLGQLALDQSEHEKALRLFTEAHTLAKDVGEHNRIAAVLTSIGETHQRMGHGDEAVTYLTQAEELCDELGDKLHLAEAKRALAKTYLEQRELKKARDCIKRAVDLFGQVRSKPHLAVALRTLGEVTGAGAWGEGHEVKAVDYFMRSIAICKEIGNELEVARSYQAFSSYVFSSLHYRQNADIQREARKLSEMADEILERHRIRSRASVA
ncbi:MAG TPA: tetratricopeptide repeat protein [Polyangiaceae bacterium]|nr:tetratricopeptide repeat protein [Polyangiaceae bacterium]